MTAIDLSHLSFSIAFWIYVSALLLYITSLVSQKAFLPKAAIGATFLGFVFHTTGLGSRWIAAGFVHPPLTDLYETLLFFVWGLVIISIYFELRHKIRVQSPFAILFTLLGMGLASLQSSKEIEPLVPALQSLWLHFHVAFAAFSYSFFLLSAVFAFLYLIKAQEKSYAIGATLNIFSAFCLMVVGGKGSLFLAEVSFNRMLEMGGHLRPSPELIPIAGLGVLFSVLILLFIVNCAIQLRAKNANENVITKVVLAVSALTFVAYVCLGGWLYSVLTTTEGLGLVSNPYRLAILLLGFIALLMQIILQFGYPKFQALLPNAATLDELSYKAVLIALPLLTIVIGTGSVWAHYAWGRFWGWDPKETWSFITWLLYAIYLHLRLQKGWTGQKLAVVAIIGFFTVIFTYLGVNILLSGLHSYA